METQQQEQKIKRNPHPDFKKVEASRPEWRDASLAYTKTHSPDWKLGDGANDGGESLKAKHVEIDPHEQGRDPTLNYKLLISGVTPRPIAFVSSRSGNVTNLAPFSYFNAVNADPPIFVIGFSGANSKDTLRNIVETKECVVNIISEHFIEAANSTSINAPYGVSEWSSSGLTPAPSTVVKSERVREAVFSIECKLVNTQDFYSRVADKKSGTLAVLEGVWFWVREDAINEERSLIDPAILRPMARMGGITYSRTLEAMEIPRPQYNS